MTQIDLNADMGESFGPWKMGADAELMPYISSANVACGGHAGDPNVMAATVRLAQEHGVQVGAHPSYPDMQGFGRRTMPMLPEEITRWVLYQLGALWAITRAEGAEMRHVKPHGALYNDASVQRPIAEAVVRAIQRFSAELLLYCLPGSVLADVAGEKGLHPVTEGFADRAYEPNGLLTSRKEPGAVHETEAETVAQALLLAAGRVRARDGSLISVQVSTICVHGDTPGAVGMARAIRQALLSSGYTIAAP